MILHDVTPNEDCLYCNKQLENPWSALNEKKMKFVCISLMDREDRAQKAQEEFHRVGLCQYVKMFRPSRGPSFLYGAWDSHHKICEASLKNSDKTNLTTIFEDDVCFEKNNDASSLVSRIGDSIETLSRENPKWNSLAWGNVSWFSMFYRPGLERCAGVCIHAYTLSHSGVKWIYEHPYPWKDKTKGQCGIDTWMHIRFPFNYRMSPIVAYQRNLKSDHKQKTIEAMFLNPNGMKNAQYWIPLVWTLFFILLIIGITLPVTLSTQNYTFIPIISSVPILFFIMLWTLVLTSVV